MNQYTVIISFNAFASDKQEAVEHLISTIKTYAANDLAAANFDSDDEHPGDAELVDDNGPIENGTEAFAVGVWHPDYVDSEAKLIRSVISGTVYESDEAAANTD